MSQPTFVARANPDPQQRVDAGDQVDHESGAPLPSHPIFGRALAPHDLPSLRGMDVALRLNQPEAALSPYSPLRAGLMALAPWQRQRHRCFVAKVGPHLVGFADFQPVLPDQRWLLVALATSSIVSELTPIWEEAIGTGVIQAGRRGVKRIYARAAQGSQAETPLHRLAFMPYASETIFVAHEVESGRGGKALRAQEQTDTWAIHQLYNTAVPRQVQYAEAFTSHRWDVKRHSLAPRNAAAAGWLIEAEHHVLGYARTLSRGGTHVLELVYHPDHLDVLSELIDGALARLPKPIRRVHCAVRGYQAEAATALERRGFFPVVEQNLYVKYTTANVRLPAAAAEVIPFHVEVRDKIPGRVPTLLHEGTRD